MDTPESWVYLENFLDGFNLDLKDVKPGHIIFEDLLPGGTEGPGFEVSNLELQCTSVHEVPDDEYYDPCLALYSSFEVVKGNNLDECIGRVERYISEVKTFDKTLSDCVAKTGGKVIRDTIEPSIGLYVARYNFPWTQEATTVMRQGVQELYNKFGERNEIF
jgi:hypothetical protein